MSDPSAVIADMQREIVNLNRQLADLRDVVAGRAAKDAANPALFAVLNFGLLEDRYPTHQLVKSHSDPNRTTFDELQELLPQSPTEVTNAIYMLAAFCFDLSRRFAAVHAAVGAELVDVTLPFNPAFQEELKKDDLELNPPNGRSAVTGKRLDWEDRARIAAKQLRKWHANAQDELEERKRHLESLRVS